MGAVVEFRLEPDEPPRPKRERKGETFVFDLCRNRRTGNVETIHMGIITARDYDAAVKAALLQWRASIRRLTLPGWRMHERTTGQETPIVPGQM